MNTNQDYIVRCDRAGVFFGKIKERNGSEVTMTEVRKLWRWDGDGSGIKRFNRETVYRIDGVNTLIRSVRGNTAHGAIVNNDLTLTPCYIVKQDNVFAHGETLREAM